MSLGTRLRRVVAAARTAASGDVPQLAPPGEFYSPVVHAGQVLAEPERSRIWPDPAPDPPGIDVRGPAQLALLEALAAHRFEPVDPGAPGRYDPTNDQFPPQDAAVLYAMVRHLRPRRVVEVGSGWSTTVAMAAVEEGALDTEVVCVEPYPRDFLGTMAGIELRRERVELTPDSVFDALGPGDVLFIDSSHVVKTGSDVVHLVLHVLPRLADGVVVHVHDVFWPEDYPEGWVRAGFNWNEQYLVQAYLAGGDRAHVVLLNRWLAVRHPAAVSGALGDLPLTGSSIWLRTGPVPDAQA